MAFNLNLALTEVSPFTLATQKKSYVNMRGHRVLEIPSLGKRITTFCTEGKK